MIAETERIIEEGKVRLSILLTLEQIKILDEWAEREYEGNRSMMVRKLIEKEEERRLKE